MDKVKEMEHFIYIKRRYALQPMNMKPNEKSALAKWFALTGLMVFIFIFISTAPLSAVPGDEDNQFETCAECHDQLAAKFANSIHAVIDKKGLADKIGAKSSCASCHGDVSKHLEEAEAGNVFAFKTTDTALAKSKMCFACHKDDHGDYFASNHAKASMACTDCHGVHNKKTAHPTKSCYKCHEDVFAKFKLNERHRLMEGVMSCESCHDPHKPSATFKLGGFKQETCFKCHTDKQGPYLHEHPVSTVEGCTACHEPHGSVNRHMLVNQSVTELCYSCHTVVPGWHSRFTEASNCASCHSTIHGSNFSPKFLK